MRIKKSFLRILLLVVLMHVLSFSVNAQFTRGTQMTFGQNRVQYNDFLWTFYRFKNFDTYFYLGGQELAVYTGRTADDEIADLEKILDYRINGRFQFIIFNRLSDMKQSNIGLEGQEQNYNTGGLTRIVGTKVLIYFDGDYTHFRQQIRAGLAQVMINQLMFGGSIKDRLQSAVLLNLPDWFTDGLINYVSTGWTVDDDNRMRDGITSGHYRKFNKMAGTEPVFAGKSIWNYIVETYGSGSVSNLLYMTRINRNIESGFIYVVGASLKDLSKNWMDYYQRMYLDDDKHGNNEPSKPVLTFKKPSRNIYQIKVSPDGNSIAYVTNELGKYKVWMFDTRTGKKKRLMKGGYRSLNQVTDLSYPVLAWHPAGRYLTVMKEKKGKVWMDYITPDKHVKRETNKFFYFDKVLDFSYNSSGSEFVLSAVQKGQSDLYTFNPRTKVYTPLTNDRWDDFSPKYVMDDHYIIFSSSRINDSLKKTDFRQAEPLEPATQQDIFLFNISNKSDQLIRITDTPNANETYPSAADSGHFSFLSDEYGIKNRVYASLDSTISYVDTVIHYRYVVNTSPLTMFNRSIAEQSYNYKSTRVADLMRVNNATAIYLNAVSPLSEQPILPYKTKLRQRLDKTAKVPVVRKSVPAIRIPEPDILQIDKKSEPANGKIDINNYQFQTEFPSKKSKKEISREEQKTVATQKEVMKDSVSTQASDSAKSKRDTALYMLPKQRNYEIAFSTNYLLTQLDNNLLNETYQSYTGGAVYFDPGLNLLFKLGINDHFDDYRITGGFRLAGNLNSNEYYISFENLKNRLDKQVSFFRQGRELVTDQSYYKVHTHEVKYILRWPFNDLLSLRGMVAYRNDRTVNLSTDLPNLAERNRYDNWGSGRIELVYDNTIRTGLNLYNGLRFKLFSEYYNQVDDKRTGNLYVLGADFRSYIKIHRQLIWANRFAASTSGGTRKLIYYLGSTDNTFVPTDNFNNEIQVDQSNNYAFQALATNLRGFVQNIRNGNSFAVFNSEIRWPIFQYLINKPIRSDFVRNFQIVGFTDVGTAWTGPSPYSKTNALFKKDYPGNPISISITKDIEPIVAGYGFGLRSRILGYFMRADWSWGIDDGIVQPRIFYFSLGLDF